MEFKARAKEMAIGDFLGTGHGRENLGDQMPVFVYRLFNYTIKDTLMKELGREKTIAIYREAGYEAGVYFAERFLDLTQELGAFVGELQEKLNQYKVGILRMEQVDLETGTLVLTVAEDVDCSGLPVLGETVCNYDEGFISGILSTYMKKPYQAIEIDCWATGDRVCRFRAEIRDDLQQE